MFNLKMSEVFSEFSGLVASVRKDKIKENFDDGVTPFDAIDYAVASHDDLVSENLSLKAEVRKLKGDDESLSLTRPNRPDLSSIPQEVVRYIESLEYGIEKVDSVCLKHATRCDELRDVIRSINNKANATPDKPVFDMTFTDCKMMDDSLQAIFEESLEALGNPDEI